MESSRKNRSLHIDAEALSTLALVQAGLISPVIGLMGEEEAKRVNKTKIYKGVLFPFAFILAPRGKRNHEVLASAAKSEVLDLICNGSKVGKIIVDETFIIDPKERLLNIYGTVDHSHPGVRNTLSRLGDLAVSGEYSVEYPIIPDSIKRVKSMIQSTGAVKVSAMMLAANPINRAHERLIRETLSSSDMLVIFLRKPFTSDGLRFDIRYNALSIFVDHYLPKNKVIIVPFENTYIFAGYNELVLDALLAKNYGCSELVVGKNHAGLGLYYDKNRINTIFDNFQNLNISIRIVDEYVYCDICKTLVNDQTCPHGRHHHIHYHSNSIMKLIQCGIIPPTILVRKEASASILTALFPNRFENLQEMHYSIMPGSGLLEQRSEEQFYIKLMELYQTTALT
jgi:sulfate adenylyltransferase